MGSNFLRIIIVDARNLYDSHLFLEETMFPNETLYTVCVSHTVAELKAEAAGVESQTELECQTQAREAENAFLREQNNLEVSKAKALSKVEVSTP